ncbi:hypothetical protein SAMN05443292_2064 [Halpernia frigidisoli]|uniref:Uncharacterized protein n=2 Tax=Halpernia frigidisoli TaxID=1125876 RepID=A0A1I3GWW4_9FLAO|nr:hypothetical protein SAMN05443292_2064 [Halpernia frigidisoli]
MLFFSLGILLYPAQNNISQNSKVMSCCSIQGNCNKDMPQKNHNDSSSRNCCNVSVAAIQFIKLEEIFSAQPFKNKNFVNKVSFFYSNSTLPNTLLEAVFQPPKFI